MRVGKESAEMSLSAVVTSEYASTLCGNSSDHIEGANERQQCHLVILSEVS